MDHGQSMIDYNRGQYLLRPNATIYEINTTPTTFTNLLFRPCVIASLVTLEMG